MKIRFLLLCFVSTYLFTTICNAEEWRSEEFNCAITLPSGAEWAQPKPPSPLIKAIAQTLDKATSVWLMVIPAPNPKSKLDDEFIKGFDKGSFPPDKSKKISGVKLIIQGVPAYKVTGEIYANGNTVQTAKIAWVADGKVYLICATKPKTAPLDDPAVKAFMASFHFLKPPHDY